MSEWLAPNGFGMKMVKVQVKMMMRLGRGGSKMVPRGNSTAV